MKIGKRGLLVLVSAAVFVLAGCEDKKGAEDQDAGKEEKPKGKEGDKCKGQEDCEFGFSCAKDDKTCQTPQTIGCRERESACALEGRCYGEKSGRCIAKFPADCKKSKVCKNEGRCTAKDGKCIAATRADCQELCGRMGHCTPKDGRCIAETDDDCKDSKRCTMYDQCVAKNGQCIKP